MLRSHTHKNGQMSSSLQAFMGSRIPSLYSWFLMAKPNRKLVTSSNDLDALVMLVVL